MQMPILTQRKLRLLVLLQKKYLYTCKNIVTKPNLEEFLRELFEEYRIENCGKQTIFAPAGISPRGEIPRRHPRNSRVY